MPAQPPEGPPPPRPERLTRDLLFDLLYQRLRKLARRHLRGEAPGRTLDTTALVHEAYLKLAHYAPGGWLGDEHLLALASRAMRQIVLDHARRRLADKRGGGARRISLDPSRIALDDRIEEVVMIDQAMTHLSSVDPRLAQLTELRFFGGLSNEEISEVLKLSVRSVEREWRKARAFLLHELGGAAGAGA